MIPNAEVKQSNKILKQDLGQNLRGDATYAWKWIPDLKHFRNTGRDFARTDSGLLVPTPNYVPVPAYPHLGNRWALCMWQFRSQADWLARFGTSMIWPNNGEYYITDMIMIEGKSPTIDATEEIIRRVKYNRSITITQLEESDQQKDEYEERSIYNKIFEQVDDALTAFGNDPGKRNSGISFGGSE